MARIEWAWSQEGPTTGYQSWDDEPLKLTPGSAIWVRVLATSDDDDTGADFAHANLVVPAAVEVAKLNQKTGDYEHPTAGASNEAVGRPPGHEVRFFAFEIRWFPAFTHMSVYLLVLPAGSTDDVTVLAAVTTTSETESRRSITVGG